MPDFAGYLLIFLGGILVIAGLTRPQIDEFADQNIDLRIEDRLRNSILRYRRAGIILGAMLIGLGWYTSSASLPESSDPEPAAPSPAVGEIARLLTFESEFIKIELPSDWTAIYLFGQKLPDLDLSELPRSVRSSILAIPTGTDELHFFAFDKNYNATLVILSSRINTTDVAMLLDRRGSLYNWIGVPVATMQSGLIINGKDAGTLVLEPMHRYEFFREKQYLVATETDAFVMIFSTLDDDFPDLEPLFEEIANSFHVLTGL